MQAKTNFSFEVQYAEHSDSTQPERDALMNSLDTTLQQLLATKDSAAQVRVSDSHKGSGNKIVELTTTLQDAQIAEILQAFSAEHGVTVSAME